MKKLISLLSASALVLSTSVLMVSCVPVQKENPLNIGKNISKVENAVNYKSGSNNSNDNSDFTNYFIVGDSLSDVDGITTMLKNKTNTVLKGVDVDITLPLDKPIGIIDEIKLKTNLTVNTDLTLNLGQDGTAGYGFKDESTGKWHSAFVNGKPAGYLLNEQLGFDDMEAVNVFSKSLNENMRNYSIGGATASDALSSISGLILNDVTVDKQAEALISQHHVEQTDNDLVFFEIGGNDLFALAGIDRNDTNLQNKTINEAMNKIKTTLFTLLNNGIEKVIIMTPPDISTLPRYKDKDKDTKKHFADLSFRFQKEMKEVIKYAQNYYSNEIQLYDIYNEFSQLKIRHKEEYKKQNPNATDEELVTNATDAYTNKTEINAEPIIVNATYLNANTGKYITRKLLTFDINNKENPIKFNMITAAQLFMSKNPTPKLTLDIKANIDVIAKRENQDNKDINSYFFTDIVHPTKLVHELVASDLKELADKFEK